MKGTHQAKNALSRSLKNLYSFIVGFICSGDIIIKHPNINLPELESLPTLDSLTILSNRVAKMSSSLGEVAQSDAYKKLEKDRFQNLTMEEIVIFEKSAFAVNIEKELREAACNPEYILNKDYYTEIRTFIFINILIDNAHRLGLLCNLILADYHTRIHKASKPD